METQHKTRYEGRRWKTIYGNYHGPEAAALNRFNALMQYFLPYVMQVEKAGTGKGRAFDGHLVLLGTRKNSRALDALVRSGELEAPEGPEGYSIRCFEDPNVPGRRIIAIVGGGPSGVLYGVIDLARRLLRSFRPDDHSRRREWLDKVKPFAMADSPKITNRGIWTWGYVIYDYRRFFDNMAELKMNMVVIWNDEPPVNTKAVVGYAHALGIKVIFGFPWGWGFKADLSQKADRDVIRKFVVKEYRSKYSKLGLDGIYFQTLTETNEKTIGGKTIAYWATTLVNEISREIFRIDPKLYLQFGLHGSSIVENYNDLRKLDPRVVIMWEDAGMMPFDYNPVTNKREFAEFNDGKEYKIPLLDSSEKTLKYSRKIALFRGKKEFAIVPKGWICLDWQGEFEHHKEYILGEQRKDLIRDRLARRQPRWDKVNKLWRARAGVAAKFYREILKLKLPAVSAAALIEDGMFEEMIQPSVYILGETLWNPDRSDAELIGAACNADDRSRRSRQA